MSFSTREIGEAYLDFFAERGHRIVEAAPLVPDDPTLLFTAAGMVQFKAFYQRSDNLPYTRAASLQPCLRVKDLDMVGKTLRHHTLFEMLGNFSFGDYFKKEAISYAWQFMTESMGIDANKLWVSVFREDDEAAELWVSEVDFPADRIVRLDEKDNFWGPVGSTGVCGPSSEIYYDTGSERSCGKPDCAVGCDCDRFIEVWNLVFPQFFKTESGSFQPLENPGIDTGMGLERMAFILQGVEDNYQTDVFRPLLECVMNEAGVSDLSDPRVEFSCKVAAEHARALTFPIAEGVFPSNEGRGYVLRRLLRRALTHLQSVGVAEPVLFKVAERVSETMGPTYPHLLQRKDHVASVVKGEEERFLRTLRSGLDHLDRIIEEARREGREDIRGRDAFYLYDTLGFPLELTEELALEKGMSIDRKGFDDAMEDQRALARGASRFSDQEGGVEAWIEIDPEGETENDPHGPLVLETRVLRFREAAPGRFPPGSGVDRFENLWEVVLARSPFYPVGGGQEADRGTLDTASGSFPVVWVQSLETQLVHWVSFENHGPDLKKDPAVVAKVSPGRRAGLRRNHTATHLLHAALRRSLGDHVAQAGSLVAEDRLRFDFSHFEALTADVIREIERTVNRQIMENIEVVPQVVAKEEAVSKGAMALFGEKYGDEVRMVEIDDVSRELCGGTHLDRTGSAGPFVITKESSAGSGIRRIEAITGPEAESLIYELRDREAELARELKTDPADLLRRVQDLQEEIAGLKSDLRKVRSRSSGGQRAEWTFDEVGGVRVAAGRFDAGSIQELRREADHLRRDLGSGAALLFSALNEKTVGMVVLTQDLYEERGLQAGDLLRSITEITGGGGGGQPLLAQGRIENPGKIDEAISVFPTLVAEAIA